MPWAIPFVSPVHTVVVSGVHVILKTDPFNFDIGDAVQEAHSLLP